MVSLDHGDPPITDLAILLRDGLVGLHAEGLTTVHPIALAWLVPVRRWLLNYALGDHETTILEALTVLEAVGAAEQPEPGRYRLCVGVRT